MGVQDLVLASADRAPGAPALIDGPSGATVD